MDYKLQLKKSEEFARLNLKECATELIWWSDTGILCNGKVRELAAMVSEFAGKNDDLAVAENLIKRAALEAVIK